MRIMDFDTLYVILHDENLFPSLTADFIAESNKDGSLRIPPIVFFCQTKLEHIWSPTVTFIFAQEVL